MDRHRKGKTEETEEKQVFEAYRLLWTKKRAVNRGQDDKVKGQELSRATNYSRAQEAPAKG